MGNSDYKSLNKDTSSSSKAASDMERLQQYIAADEYLRNALKDMIEQPVLGLTVEPESEDSEESGVPTQMTEEELESQNAEELLDAVINANANRYKALSTGFKVLAVASFFVGAVAAVGGLVLASPVIVPIASAMAALAMAGLVIGCIGYAAVGYARNEKANACYASISRPEKVDTAVSPLCSNGLAAEGDGDTSGESEGTKEDASKTDKSAPGLWH